MRKRKASKQSAFKKRVSRKRPKLVSKTEQLARRMVRRLPNLRMGGLLGIEVKWADHGRKTYFLEAWQPSPTSAYPITCRIPPSTSVNNIFGVDRGNGPTERDGNIINLRELYFTYSLIVPSHSAAELSHGQVMVALIVDTQTNGTVLDINEVYNNPSDDPNTGVIPLRKLDETNRFKVLYRKVHNLTNYDAMWNPNLNEQVVPGDIRTFKKRINLKGTKVTFKSNVDTGQTVNITDNSLHVFACTTNTIPPIAISYNARVRFVG